MNNALNYRFLLRHPRSILPVIGAVAAAVMLMLSVTEKSVNAQNPSKGLEITEFVATQTGETDNTVKFEARVNIQNSSESDFAGTQRVDLQIGDDTQRLVYIVSKLAASETLSFTFSFELQPGKHSARVTMGDSQASLDLRVAGADVALKITNYRIARGRIVEFDLAIANSGDLVAENLTLTSTWRPLEPDREGTFAGSMTYQGDIPSVAAEDSASLTMAIIIPPGSYRFSFNLSTSSLDTEPSNNVANIDADIEFIDLRTRLVGVDALGWNPEGDVLMSLVVEIDNSGVDDINAFYVGIKCTDMMTKPCSDSFQVEKLRAGHITTASTSVWLPPGDVELRIFAVEDEDTFRWGNSNVVATSIAAPTAPEQVWTLADLSQPEVVSYWSDGSATIQFGLTMLNNGTDQSTTVTVTCVRDDSFIEDCESAIDVKITPDVHPTVVRGTLRVPQGETTLLFDYGGEEIETSTATVPERIIGVQREVWDCFSDTSNLDIEEDQRDKDNDEGIGCAGWEAQTISKWPVGKPIKLWTFGDTHYLKILDETIAELGPFLNVEFERVATKSEAQLKVFAGIDRNDAATTGLDCVEFGGCARTRIASDGRITSSRISIWTNGIRDVHRRDHAIRAITLHELLHALTKINHRHHDRTSVMSYESLDYVSIDGMDRGLFELLAHPLVQPGMTFDEVLELIVFSDELNDPPKPKTLSAPALLRRVHAAMMDAGSFSFQVKGNWPGCSGNHRFGWAHLQSANLRPYSALWQHFLDSSDRYYYIGNPSDWSRSEWWLRRGNEWAQTDVNRISDATTYRAGFSSPISILDNINVHAYPPAYSISSRTDSRVEIHVQLYQPNPDWSSNLDLRIDLVVNPTTYHLVQYQMRWNFTPREANNCDTYVVGARNPQYGIDFIFPDAIQQDSILLNPSGDVGISLSGVSDPN